MFDKAFETRVLNKYMPVPYVHHGRDMEGLDCYGLIIAVKAEQGFKIYDTEEDYTENWSFKNKNYFVENYHREWVKVDKPRPGDVVLFKATIRTYNQEGESTVREVVNHGGIVLHNSRFLHTCKAGTVVTRLAQRQWTKKLYGFFRLKVEND